MKITRLSVSENDLDNNNIDRNLKIINQSALFNKREAKKLPVEEKYRLANISDLIDPLGKCQYFITLDQVSGFH